MFQKLSSMQPERRRGAEGPIVWVMQQPLVKTDGWKPDLTSAERYGRIEFLLPMGHKTYVNPLQTQQLLYPSLQIFDPAHDYLLWANFADIASSWMVVAMLTAAGYKELKYLYWQSGREAGTGLYIPVTLSAE